MLVICRNSCIFCNSCVIQHGICVRIRINRVNRTGRGRLALLCHILSVGINLLAGSFCGLLGLLCGFQDTVVLLSINPASTDLFNPLGSMITGLNILNIQLIRNTAAIIAVGNSPTLSSGQFLSCGLLSKSSGNSVHIPGLAQLGEPLRCCALDGTYIAFHDLIMQFQQLTTGQFLAFAQSAMHLLSKIVIRVNFQSFINQCPRIATIDTLRFFAAVEVADCIAGAAHSYAHQGTACACFDHLGQRFLPCTVFQFIPGVIGEVTIDHRVIGDVSQLCQCFLRRIYQHRFSQILNNRLYTVWCNLFELVEIANGKRLEKTFEHAGEQAVPERLTITHTPCKGIIGTLCCSG